jgi:hypothetical protein
MMRSVLKPEEVQYLGVGWREMILPLGEDREAAQRKSHSRESRTDMMAPLTVAIMPFMGELNI